jgi:hypothetical protein
MLCFALRFPSFPYFLSPFFFLSHYFCFFSPLSNPALQTTVGKARESNFIFMFALCFEVHTGLHVERWN